MSSRQAIPAEKKDPERYLRRLILSKCDHGQALVTFHLETPGYAEAHLPLAIPPPARVPLSYPRLKMKTNPLVLFSSISFFAPTALACLRVHGYIVHDPLVGTTMDADAEAIDNGVVVCSARMGLRTDQDGHFSLGCLPGYVYAVTKDGKHAWFHNPQNRFEFDQSVKVDRYCCHGACEDRGVKITCTDYSWDVHKFC